MKKGLVIASLACALSLGLVACKKNPVDPGEKHTVSITNKDTLAEIWSDDFSKSVSIEIKDTDVIVADAFLDGDLVVTSSDTSVLTISGDSGLRPVAAGTTTVKAIYKNNEAWSDSVEITVLQRPAMRKVANPTATGEYYLGFELAGEKKFATGKVAATYYLEAKGIDDAVLAKVTVGEGEYPYSIALATSEGDKVIGSAVNGSGTNKHYNIGFVGSNVPDVSPAVPYVEAKFKLNSDLTLSTIVDDKECFIGTSGTKGTLSFSYTDKSDFNTFTKGYLWEFGDPIPATAIGVTPVSLSLDIGGTGTLTAELEPANSTDVVSFTTNNKDVATVNSQGVVTGVGAGSTTITVKANDDVHVDIPVTVSAQVKHGTTLEDPLSVAEAVAIAEGAADTTVYYVKGIVSKIVSPFSTQYNNMSFNVTDNGTNTFQFYKTNVSSTQKDSVILGNEVIGHGQITKYNTTYEFKWVQNEIDSTLDTVTVPTELSLVVITGENQGILTLEDVELTATLYPAGSTGTVVWASSDDSKATVTQSGVVHAVAVGSTVITATVGDIHCSLDFSVVAPEHGMTENDPLNVDEALEKAIACEHNTPTITKWYIEGIIQSSTWSTQYSNGEARLIGTDTEKGTAGKTFLFYRVGGTQADFESNFVVGAVVKVRSQITRYNETYETVANPTFVSSDKTAVTLVKITGNASVTVGENIELTATAYPEALAVATFTWSVVAEEGDHASVSGTTATGTVHGVSEGTAHIKAEAPNGKSATFEITVNPAGTVPLAIATSIAVGDTVYLASNTHVDLNKKIQLTGISNTSTKYGEVAVFTTSEPSKDFPLVVEAGSEANTFSFKTSDNKYLYWTSGNSLATNATKDAKTSWKVEIDSSGNATIKNCHDETRVLWYNDNNTRIAAYTGKSHGKDSYNNYYCYVQFWK